MSDKFRIDSHKLIFHPERVAQWKSGYEDWETAKKVYPIYLEISPTGSCNHRCSFCGLDFLGYQNRKIPFETLKNTLTDIALLGVKSVMFGGEGEPTLYKELPEILDHCTNIGIDTSLTTNMVPFTEKNTASFIKNCKWIKVSINAGNAGTYSKIHGTQEKDFYKVIDNMRQAVSVRNEKGYSCTLGAQMLLLDDNYHSVVELAELTQGIGLDYLVIKPYSQHLSSITTRYKDIDYSRYLDLDEKLKNFNTESFKVIFRKNTMEKIIDHRERYKKCSAVPFIWGYIMSNGEVYGCSCFLENKKFCYGNITEQSFQEIWEGESRKNGYEYVKNDLNVEKCRENCRMDEINRYLWELTHPNPHVNFI